MLILVTCIYQEKIFLVFLALSNRTADMSNGSKSNDKVAANSLADYRSLHGSILIELEDPEDFRGRDQEQVNPPFTSNPSFRIARAPRKIQKHPRPVCLLGKR